MDLHKTFLVIIRTGLIVFTVTQNIQKVRNIRRTCWRTQPSRQN